MNSEWIFALLFVVLFLSLTSRQQAPDPITPGLKQYPCTPYCVEK